jgi:ADP-heptose:LPS heptosyltransferase
VPYLRSGEPERQHWQQRLGERRRGRVGVVWSGGFRPHQPQVWPANQRRNIALAQLAPLFQCKADFFSLQKGEPAESELAHLITQGWRGQPLCNYAAELRDFADTAGLIEQLDLVISVDTATAHLAAALGKRTWLLNRYDTDWRWLLERRDSPWYPTLRIYRQPRPGDWESVVCEIQRDLAEWAQTME